ncbi:hypothetical protein HBB16_16920 [Pseudonocardia sp. MCCB 268]|nr:hypothetical protein [Pseudonocardia cytotoxica]
MLAALAALSAAARRPPGRIRRPLPVPVTVRAIRRAPASNRTGGGEWDEPADRLPDPGAPAVLPSWRSGEGRRPRTCRRALGSRGVTRGERVPSVRTFGRL